MRTLFGGVLALLLLASPAHAQVQVQITLGLPVVLPSMVVVQPGVQVVSELDDEIYFVGGWYWVRRGPHWYRTHDHRGRWLWVEPRYVPAALVRIPSGQYRHIRHDEWRRMEHDRKERESHERRRQHSPCGHAWRGRDHIPHRSRAVHRQVAVEPRNFFAHDGDHIRVRACTSDDDMAGV